MSTTDTMSVEALHAYHLAKTIVTHTDCRSTAIEWPISLQIEGDALSELRRNQGDLQRGFRGDVGSLIDLHRPTCKERKLWACQIEPSRVCKQKGNQQGPTRHFAKLARTSNPGTRN